MLRWLAVCVLLAGGTFALVAFAAQKIPGLGLYAGGIHFPGGPDVRAEAREEEKGEDEAPRAEGATKVTPPVREERRNEEPSVQDVDVRFLQPAGGQAAALVIPEARVLPTDRQEVPSEHDGKLIFLGTELKPEESATVAELKKQGKALPAWYINADLGFLAVEVNSGEQVPAGEQIVFTGSPKVYRRWKEGDQLIPGRVVVAKQTREFRKLEVGDRVERGQLLGLVNPAVAFDELSIKTAKLEAADADYRAAIKTRDEAEKRYDSMTRQRAVAARSVSDEEYRGAKLTWDRYIEEAIAKGAQIAVAQRELNAALTTLNMHEIRSSIPGLVKVLYKSRGDAVKNLDAVLQLQNPKLLIVEGLVEVQDAKRLTKELEQARSQHKPVEVTVEATQPEPPFAQLNGHLHEVNCVAVSKGPNPLIVSGSEDQTVRIWGRGPSPLWQERCRIDHHAVVRALACTPPTAKRNLLLTGTGAGVGRLFNLDDLKAKEIPLQGRHDGAINCVAFSPDGKVCVTGGDDRSICLWNTDDGTLLRRYAGAHKAALTSLAYTPANQLVTAGRDNRLLVWNVGPGQVLSQADEYDRRSGDVAQLGVSPDGKLTLFDQVNELRVLSLAERQIVGTLQNPAGAANFATLALFAPDGKTILTNGAAPGRLQLWRASANKGRGAEVRQFIWNNGVVSCGAFAPDGSFAVTGTQDHQVLVWAMPTKEEVEQRLMASLSYIEEFQDTSIKKVPIRAQLESPGWLIPGGTATMVIPHPQVSVVGR